MVKFNKVGFISFIIFECCGYNIIVFFMLSMRNTYDGSMNFFCLIGGLVFGSSSISLSCLYGAIAWVVMVS